MSQGHNFDRAFKARLQRTVNVQCAAKERQKASQAAELQQLVDERRAAKQAAEKREEAKALAQRKAREAAAEAKEAMMRERRDYMERCKEWTLAKKLEKGTMAPPAASVPHPDHTDLCP